MSIQTVRRSAPAHAGRQAGLTLVELSITMLIALFLLGGLLTIVQHTRKTYSNQNQLTQLQDAERLAMSIVTDVVQSAGYFPDPTNYTASGTLPAAAAATPIPAFLAGQAISGSKSGTIPEDILAVRYTSLNEGSINCLGQTNTTGAAVGYTNTFSIVASSSGGSLNCTLFDGTNTTNQILVDGVTNLQVWYGVKRNFALDDYNVDSYLRQDEMTLATDWANVSAIRIIITFVNPLKSEAGQPATIDFERVIAVMNRAGVKT